MVLVRVMRVVSYNVHAFVGADGRRRPERVAEVLRELDFDVAALQEVESDEQRGARLDALRELASERSAEFIVGPTLRRSDRDYGNLVLSRLPVTRVRRHLIGVSGREPRGVIDLELAPPGHIRLRLLATHLGLRGRERKRQTDRLLALIGNDRGPVILAADLNEWWPLASSLGRLCRALPGGRPRRSFPARVPLFALDRILVKPASLVHSIHVHRSALARRASDHLPLVAELDLPPRDALSS